MGSEMCIRDSFHPSVLPSFLPSFLSFSLPFLYIFLSGLCFSALLFFLLSLPGSLFLLRSPKLVPVFTPPKGPVRGGTDWRETLGRRETQGWKDVSDFPTVGSPTKFKNGLIENGVIKNGDGGGARGTTAVAMEASWKGGCCGGGGAVGLARLCRT